MDQFETLTGLLPSIRADLRRMAGQVFPGTQEVQMGWQDEQDEVIVVEPIVAKKDCQLEITSVEPATWTVKPVSAGGAPGYEGQEFKTAKMTLTITDPNIQTEHENARPRLTIEHQFNLDRYPYLEKKSGSVKWLGRANLYELEEAFGFDPIFTNGEGQPVEPYLTRTGRKLAPKGEGIKRHLNPAFVSAYFTADGNPNLEWAGKTLFADIGIQTSDQYGDKNVIQRFKRTPVSI